MQKDSMALEIGNNLKTILDRMGLTQEQLAAMLEIRQASVSNWIRGRNRPKIDKLVSIGLLLDVPLNQIAPSWFGKRRTKEKVGVGADLDEFVG